LQSVIDLHCHVLPGIDDGALSVEDAVGMGRQADDDGIEAICATPHIRNGRDVRIAELPERVAALNDAFAHAGVRVRALPGGEVAETIAEQLTDDDLRAVSLGGGGRWILLEPRPGPLVDELAAMVEQLRERGFRCLVTHPERHLADDLADRLAALVQRGALVQATAGFFEQHGPIADAMLRLAADGLIHVVASDAHSSHAGRPVRLSGALTHLSELPRTASHVEWMARSAPRAIVAGEDVEPPFAPALLED
jgi:protein-tyrosine phosphatase